MSERFKQIVRGAALMTATEATIEPWLVPYKARWPNATLNRLYLEAAEQCGLHPEISDRPGRASSDFGDISQQIPGAHVYFGISRKTIAGHSPDFRKAAGSSHGINQMLKTAAALALAGYRYFTEEDVRQAVGRDFSETQRRRVSPATQRAEGQENG